jgi:hypothetical protein
MAVKQLEEVDFLAAFEEVENGVLASYCVKFPPKSGLRNQRASLIHPDRSAAETWIQAQAERRCIKHIRR